MFPLRIISLTALASLLVTPSLAQFGLGGQKRKATSFQELNERAAKQEQQGSAVGTGAAAGSAAGLAGMEDLLGNMEQVQEMWEKLLKTNPQGADSMNLWGDKMNEAMEELSKMSPEQLQKQMQDALAMLTKDDMVDAVVQQKDQILKTLEDSHLVTEEELAKYKENPKYFELKMRESFDQMKDIFSDPDVMKAALDGMTKFQQAMADPGKFYSELAKALKSDLNSDEKIEEARLQLIADPKVSDDPLLSALFQSEEMQDLLKDPVKWRTSVKSGQKDLFNQGAGIGEL